MKISSYFCFRITSLDQKSTKSQILSLSGPIAFMHYLIVIQLSQVLDNQKN